MSKLAGIFSDFGLAWRLLTAVPLPLVPENFERPAGPSVGYYPLVGLILGLFLAAAYQLLGRLLPPGLAAALLLIFWAGLTGLLHLDGFMDSCDGLLPPRSPERRLEIMKDSRVGAFGVVGAILLLLLKYNALLALPSAAALPALITIPSLARWTMTWQLGRYPLVRQEGLSVFFRQGLKPRYLILATVVVIILALSLLGWLGAILLIVTWLVAIILARFTLARLGGLSGDVYGATCEVCEVVLLVILASLRS